MLHAFGLSGNLYRGLLDDYPQGRPPPAPRHRSSDGNLRRFEREEQVSEREQDLECDSVSRARSKGIAASLEQYTPTISAAASRGRYCEFRFLVPKNTIGLLALAFRRNAGG